MKLFSITDLFVAVQQLDLEGTDDESLASGDDEYGIAEDNLYVDGFGDEYDDEGRSWRDSILSYPFITFSSAATATAAQNRHSRSMSPPVRRTGAFRTLKRLGTSEVSDVGTSVQESRRPLLAPVEKESVWRSIPWYLVGNYALVALHATIFDQLFMSLLLTPIAANGLGINAVTFAQLIACLCFLQMVFQFVVYPALGPPTGPLSYTSMFVLGLTFYLPTYILVPSLRHLLQPTDNPSEFLLISSRSFGGICAYTSISILLNESTPPKYIPYANGLAQSFVSLARFAGPMLGGFLWSLSMKSESESTKNLPFLLVASMAIFPIVLPWAMLISSLILDGIFTLFCCFFRPCTTFWYIFCLDHREDRPMRY
ncbi:hypothetical protein BT69DRAFT_1357270 [Atractiella rhizophila]|nr:hypothetical protein BT69DRAFT_1357270 [Atractiella rhizophila]